LVDRRLIDFTDSVGEIEWKYMEDSIERWWWNRRN